MIGNSRVQILENVIKQMLQPLKGLPFDLVLESLAGKKIIPISKEDDALLEKIDEAAIAVFRTLKINPIQSKRPNEVGNYIEPLVKAALIDQALKVETPSILSGKKKATGYPDLLVLDNNKPTYLECKTFNIESIDTSLRAFYLFPSDDFKVSLDARHLLIAFEMIVVGQINNLNLYAAKSYKLLSLENLLLDVKYEFNASNKGLYQDTLLLKSRDFEQ